jgi:hypothetical protein
VDANCKGQITINNISFLASFADLEDRRQRIVEEQAMQLLSKSTIHIRKGTRCRRIFFGFYVS